MKVKETFFRAAPMEREQWARAHMEHTVGAAKLEPLGSLVVCFTCNTFAADQGETPLLDLMATLREDAERRRAERAEAEAQAREDAQRRDREQQIKVQGVEKALRKLVTA